MLEYQISSQDRNLHFRTMSMIYYGNLLYRDKVRSDEYFANRVSNSLFYALEDEFFAVPYLVPKNNLGLRKYKFLSYPLRLVYYAIGIYILKLTQDLVAQHTTDNRGTISSYYGGNIHFNNGQLALSPSTIYYRKHYLRFKKTAEEEAKRNLSSKTILHLDFQNYFEYISVPKLLELLDEYCMPQTARKMNYDTTTRDHISFFFRFLMGDEGGIPQMDNDIISNFIGHLYMVFGDQAIRDVLRELDEYFADFHIIRYVDDVYISLEFDDRFDSEERKKHTRHVASIVSDRLFEKLGLRLNVKTRMFDMMVECDDYVNSLKRVSPDLALGGENEDENPQRAVERIVEQLEELKNSGINNETMGYAVNRDILSNLFDERVQQLLNHHDNLGKLRTIFTGFDFEKVKALPLPIILLLMKDKIVERSFQDFLLSKRRLTTSDIDLIIRYQCQYDFVDSELMETLGQSPLMQEITLRLQSKYLNTSNPGYFSLSEGSTLRISDNQHVIEQARQRVMNERLGHYSAALNHLLNEIHAIIFYCDQEAQKFKNYNREQVVSYLNRCGVPFDVYNGIRQLFDRRNANPISHPGHDQGAAWSVSPREYWDYHSKVKKCLNWILEDN